LDSIKDTSTNRILKGKQPAVLTGVDERIERKTKKPPDKPWMKPPLGWVKLTVDGLYKDENGSAGTSMVLRDDAGEIIFSACRSLASC
jgi:hypothetical protein